MPEDVQQTIQQNAQQPRRASADGVEAEQHPLPDQIAADRYLASKEAVDATPSRGLRWSKLQPGGAA